MGVSGMLELSFSDRAMNIDGLQLQCNGGSSSSSRTPQVLIFHHNLVQSLVVLFALAAVHRRSQINRNHSTNLILRMNIRTV